MFVCELCYFRCQNFHLYVKHTFESHSTESNFKFTCGVDSCQQTFRRYSAIKSHFNRKHRGSNFESVELHRNIQSSARNESEENNGGDYDNFDMNGNLFNGDSDLDNVSDIDIHDDGGYSSSIEHSAGLFLITLKERYRLTQVAVDFAIEQVQMMIQRALSDAKNEVESLIPANSIPGLSTCFEVVDPFSMLQTEFLQTKFYKEHFGLVVRIMYLICYCTCVWEM